ncbi:MAG: type I secretion system permease/ATPase [Methylobacterium sp.]|nr:type I secretion system permease/ATPase [Methylobacterium sp.]MCA3651452.1 type I secretion system permease/ATPase [Methylobacterium sp.]MCA4922544.1 type I secretion system permease/ATPase [Methylobacterium sp.]
MTYFSPLARTFLKGHSSTISYIVGLSAAVNFLALTGAIYMIQIYDRVLVSKSGATLVYVTLIMLVLYGFYYLFDLYRCNVISLVGRQFEETYTEQVLARTLSMQVESAQRERNSNAMRDLEEVGRFISSSAPIAVFDLPWIPIFIIVCFLFHPIIGGVTLLFLCLAIALMVIGERQIRAASDGAADALRSRAVAVDTAVRNAEAIVAMGIGQSMQHRVLRFTRSYLNAASPMARNMIRISGMTRTIRLIIQSLLLGIAAWLVVIDQATPGVMIASAVVAGRALAPIDAIVGRWRQFVQMQECWRRLEKLLLNDAQGSDVVQLPPPTRIITVDDVSVGPLGSPKPLVRNVTFSLRAGDRLGIIGPSGSGKSTLVRAITDVWRPCNGSVRFDGAELRQHAPEQRARIIGYLPQDVQLLRGTVAENICRFDPHSTAAEMVAAAKAAGAHEMILSLPNGYMTDVGENGSNISGGQRQRIGLARALYGDPFLVILDEPNSNLDANGEKSLNMAIQGVAARGGIVIIVAHRLSALKDTNKLLLLVDGQVQAFGSSDEVMGLLSGGVKPEAKPQVSNLPPEKGASTQDKQSA